jgi:recombination protein U
MIKYPTKKTTVVNHSNSSGKLGMSLEEDINQTNTYYLTYGLANVHKKPTPVQVVTVNYPARNKAKIVEAYYKKPSTTDYNGVYQGYALDFEAKETNHVSLFSLKNIHQHQLEHLEDVQRHGAIAFLIIRFSRYNETYLLFYHQLEAFLKNNQRKSIPRTYLQEHAALISYSLTPPVDYLPVIKEALKNKE